MLRINLILIYIFIVYSLHSIEIYTHFIQIYGEGPLGQHIVDFVPKYYEKEESIKLAKDEVLEYLSGMIYGYNFSYKVENNITGAKGYFELIPLVKLKENDKNLTLSQLEESNISIRVQATYRLNEDQKNHIKGFQSVIARMSMGESTDSFTANEWTNRFNVYKNSVRNAVLNSARKDIKSRPNYITGKILLAESPKYSIISGEWRCIVKIHLIIKDVTYNDVY
ncbi:MAG TPA: hypothetical protein PK771_11800 [Spirochaetota bacterium]|nr:hypothetical protein [Spirochaetota bacterium]